VEEGQEDSRYSDPGHAEREVVKHVRSYMRIDATRGEKVYRYRRRKKGRITNEVSCSLLLGKRLRITPDPKEKAEERAPVGARSPRKTRSLAGWGKLVTTLTWRGKMRTLRTKVKPDLYSSFERASGSRTAAKKLCGPVVAARREEARRG